MPEADPPSLSRYQVITTLGQGGMARVLLTMSRGPAGVTKLLVVKELKDELKSDPEFVTMFLDEARIAARLNHPNVIQTYEVGSDGEHPFIVMEYLEGQALSAVLGRVGRKSFPLGLHLHALAQTAAGLHYAHELKGFDGAPLGLVHRDVSPHNVFVTYDGRVLLVDFGIAKAADSAGLTRAGVFKGKLGYAAPEQLEGKGNIDRRADIFALGVMLWEALAMRRLTFGEPEHVIMARRASGEDLKIASVAPDAPPELCRIVDRAMAHDPADRFATAAELRAELEAFLESSKRVGGEEIGKLVRETFAADRQRVLSLVEAQMKVMAAPPGPGETPPPPLAEPAPVSRRDQSEPRDSTVKVTATTAPSAAHKPEAPGRGRLFLGVGLALAVAVLVFVGMRSAGSSATQSASTTTAPSNAASAAARPATVDVWISVDPPEARLTLDEVALSSNPFHAAMPESTLARKLRVSAPGFVTDERLITLDRDLHLEMALKAAPGAPTASNAAPALSAPLAPGGAPGGPRLPGAMLPPTGLGKPTATAAAGPAPGEAIAPQPKKSTRSIDDTF
jgi:serine/threonine-protein kinase